MVNSEDSVTDGVLSSDRIHFYDQRYREHCCEDHIECDRASRHNSVYVAAHGTLKISGTAADRSDDDRIAAARERQ